jgi:tetratricopeptide (TPR) repeat protein
VETALKLEPENPEVLWARAEIEEAKGQADVAIADLRKALALKPGLLLAADAMKRLGVGSDVEEDREISGLGVEGWRVVARANKYFALADAFPALRVPLEMLGEGKPQLVAWEIRPPPHQGYGLLRYDGGAVPGKTGPEATELAAIVDIEASKVVAIQPNRQGARVANWVWDEDRLQVASVDGVTDEFQLRAVAPPAGAFAGQRRPADAKGAAWDPWNDQMGGYAGGPRSEPRTAAKRSSQKPKSLFDLLFNN